MKCQSCTHWRADPLGDAGECRAHPPVIVDALVTVVLSSQRVPALGDAVFDATRWPATKGQDGCGEHHSQMPC